MIFNVILIPDKLGQDGIPSGYPIHAAITPKRNKTGKGMVVQEHKPSCVESLQWLDPRCEING